MKNKNVKDSEMRTPRKKDAAKKISMTRISERSLGKVTKRKGLENSNVRKIRNMFENSSPQQVIEGLSQPNLMPTNLPLLARLNPEICVSQPGALKRTGTGN